MNKLLLTLFLLVQSHYVAASNQTDCGNNGGSYITGTVVGTPQFGNSKKRIHGVQLSHTFLKIKSDQDGHTYEVAIDNVFAVDYNQNAQSSPLSLAAIYEGDHLELCGEMYGNGNGGAGSGIHWVHNNCNATGTTKAPNGWVKQIAEDGTVGANMESSQTYCYLWARDTP